MSRRNADVQRAYDYRREQSLPWRKWYRTAAWQSIRKRRMAADPLCVRCLAHGKTVPTTTINHIKPHRGDRALFFCYGNTESVCADCHDRHIQREEVRGYSGEVGADGWPVDPRHPVNCRGRGGRVNPWPFGEPYRLGAFARSKLKLKGKNPLG